jgi:hypothetical protein
MYTAYFLSKYLENFPEKEKKLEIDELAKHLLYSLVDYSKLFLYSGGKSERDSDLKCLEALNIIGIDGRYITVKDKELLDSIANIMKPDEDTPLLLKEYLERIDKTIEKIKSERTDV